MTNIRPDKDEIIKILNLETNRKWDNTTDKLDELTFMSGHYEFKITYNERKLYNGKWTFEITDLNQSNCDKPHIMQGPFSNDEKIKNGLESLPEMIKK